MSNQKKQSNSSNEDHSGSLGNSEPEFLAVGKIGRTHGLRGELWMNIYTDFPERLTPGKSVFIGRQYEEKIIASFKLNSARGLICFRDIETPEDADILKNKLVYVKQELVPQLPEGEYYHHDLIGIQVMDETRRVLGILSEILSTGANDVYVVKDLADESIEVLIPAIPSVIRSIDIQSKIMVVKPQEWV